MHDEIRAYLRLEARVAAAFNFFISGMIIALIYHQADTVATDAVSIGIDLAITCLLIFTVSAFFCRASLRRTKTAGILEPPHPSVRYLSRLFRRPLRFGFWLGLVTAAALFAVTAPILVLLGFQSVPFGLYVALKTLFCALLGGGVAWAELYLGMCRV